MRNPFRRRVRQIDIHAGIGFNHPTAVTVKIDHTITHKHESAPPPEYYRLFWECDGVVYQSLWRTNLEYDADIPMFVTERSQSQGMPIRLRIQPVARP